MQPLDFQNDSILPLDGISGIVRRILREEFWCRLKGSEGFIHFGWDYYMYVGVPHPCPTAEARATELGLYVEEFASPIGESVREAESLKVRIIGKSNVEDDRTAGIGNHHI
jgi:hypothetical protein